MLYKLFGLALLLLATAACAPVGWFVLLPAYSVTSTPPPVQSIEKPATAVFESIASLDRPALTWEGQTESADSGAYRCTRLELGADKEARIGECGGTRMAGEFVVQRDREWSEIQGRFAPFEYRSATDHLIFHGAGTISGAEWQRAILSWVHTTYDEVSSGRVSAALRTKMNWMLDPITGQAGRCAHLTVLSFGYAFADTFPCEGGGAAQDSQSGWLETAEMRPFDAWLYGRANYSAGANYFEGAGAQGMSEQDVQEMTGWAQSVYLRLKPKAALAPVKATQLPAPTRQPSPAATSAPGSNSARQGWKTFASERYHYVVSYPADWTIEIQTQGAAGTGNGPEYVYLRPTAAMLPTVEVYALEGAAPITGFENCDKNLVFRDATLACSISLPKGQNPAQQLLVFQRGDSHYQIAIQYEEQEQLAVFEEIVKSFQFTQ